VVLEYQKMLFIIESCLFYIELYISTTPLANRQCFQA